MAKTFFYITRSFTWMILLGFLIVLAVAAITDWVFFLTDKNPAPYPGIPITSPIDVAGSFFAFLTGAHFFTGNFKIALANGISRKTFLIANLPAGLVTSAVFSIVNVLIMLVHNQFVPVAIILVSGLIYPFISLNMLLVFQFSAFFFLMVLGWFVSILYYRCSSLGKIIVTLAPFVLLGVVELISAYFGGRVLSVLYGLFYISMNTPNKATLFLLAYTIILMGLTYLVIRRTPLNL